MNKSAKKAKKAALKEMKSEFKDLCGMDSEWESKSRSDHVAWCKDCGRPENVFCYQCKMNGTENKSNNLLMIHPEQQLVYCMECYDKLFYEFQKDKSPGKTFILPDSREWVHTRGGNETVWCRKNWWLTVFNRETGGFDEIQPGCTGAQDFELDQMVKMIEDMKHYIHHQEIKGDANKVIELKEKLEDHIQQTYRHVQDGDIEFQAYRRKIEYEFDQRIKFHRLGVQIKSFNIHDGGNHLRKGWIESIPI